MATDTTNWDDLDDDAFMSALEDASYAPEEENVEEEIEENIEDTDQKKESFEEETEEPETNEQIDDEVQDSGEAEEIEEDEANGENSQVEESSSEAEEADKASGSKDESETEDPGEDKKAEKINYEEEYKKIIDEKAYYENFYNEVTGEFVANGKKIKGFNDPKKIIEAQQMAAGYSEKMAGFKKYRPYMNALKEKGLLDSPDKFNLALSLLEGDPEALKKQIKDLEIDPFEMDMENIDYKETNQVSSPIEIALDDVMTSASQHGVDKQVQDIISNDWDDDSIIELLNDPQNSSDLISHISSGAYDVVQERISEKQRTDVNNIYSNKNKIQQYREAAMEIESEYVAYMQQQESMQNQNNQEPVQQEQVPAQQIDVAAQVEREEYTKQVEKQKAKTNEARRKATSLSKKKRGSKKPKQMNDPLTEMNDEQFTDFLDSMIDS